MEKELMAAINAQADRADEARPKMMHREALADELHKDFPDFSSDDIAAKLEDVWRSRNLFFATVHR